MVSEALGGRADFYQAAAAALDAMDDGAKLNLEDMEAALEEYKRESDAAVLQELEGWLIFQREPPRQRLAAFLAATHPDDYALVLDPEYLRKLRAGLAPPPVSPMWQLALQCRDLFWEWLSGEFRTLLKAERRKQEA